MRYATGEGNMMFRIDDAEKVGPWESYFMSQPYCKSVKRSVCRNVMKSESGDAF